MGIIPNEPRGPARNGAGRRRAPPEARWSVD
jgi:hypothetical protein